MADIEACAKYSGITDKQRNWELLKNVRQAHAEFNFKIFSKAIILYMWDYKRLLLINLVETMAGLDISSSYITNM